jgi:hypothetical protein
MKPLCLVVLSIVAVYSIIARADDRPGITVLGTIFYFIHTTDYQIVAIDRRNTRVERGITSHDDRVCKILPLDDRTIFFNYGFKNWISPAGEVMFDSYELAKARFANGKDIADIVRQWSVKHKENLELWYISDPTAELAIRELREKNPTVPFFQKAYFSSSTNADVSLYGVSFVANNSFTAPHFNDPVIETVGTAGRVTGHPDLINEIRNNQSERARRLSARIEVASKDRLTEVEKSATSIQLKTEAIIGWANDPRIGGEVAVVILEKGKKLRWFRRPSFC